MVKYLRRVCEEENLWKTCIIQPLQRNVQQYLGLLAIENQKYNAKIVKMTKLFSFSKIYKVTSVGSNFIDIKG